MKGLTLQQYFIALVMLLSVSFLNGCMLTTTQTEVQLPIQDMRPQLQFTIHQQADASNYVVYLNELKLGTVADFLVHQDSLRLLSGRQHLKIMLNQEIVLARDLFLQEGARQFIHVPTEHEAINSEAQAQPTP